MNEQSLKTALPPRMALFSRSARPIRGFEPVGEHPPRPLASRTLLAMAGIALLIAAICLMLTPVAPGTPGIALFRHGMILGICLGGMTSLWSARKLRR